jgi:hypothetical protein
MAAMRKELDLWAEEQKKKGTYGEEFEGTPFISSAHSITPWVILIIDGLAIIGGLLWLH